MPDTIPKFLTENARTRPDDDAMREKEFGIWQTYSWRDYAEEVQRLACGLAELGFKRGDKVAIIGDNRPKLYFAMLAAQSLGGISVALISTQLGLMVGVPGLAAARLLARLEAKRVRELLQAHSVLVQLRKVPE